jgi:FkbM family methyltransferase
VAQVEKEFILVTNNVIIVNTTAGEKMKRFNHSALQHLHFRNSQDSMDEKIIREVRCYEPLYNVMKDKVVFDLGANIGAYSYYSLQYGAKHVYAFEPSEENFELLSSQPLDPEKITLFRTAISNETNANKPFYVNEGKCKARHSLIANKRKRKEEIIPTVALKEVCQKYKPDIIKCDIEFGEYLLDFPNDINPECTHFGIEIHNGCG